MRKDWSSRRILYLLGGLLFIFVAVKDQVWWMGVFGIYFASMSLFRFGCAAGNCEVPFEKHEQTDNPKN